MSHRIQRVNQLIREEISDLLKREIKDPRLSTLLAVTHVDTTVDLRYARVLVSQICNDDDKKEVIEALTSASGFLRNELVKRLRIRRVPELSFFWDDSIERGAQVLELLDKVKSDHSDK